MISVFKREFSSLFHRLYGYITVGVTALFSAIIFISYNLSYTYDTTNYLMSAMSIVAALVIPVTAVSVFANKKKGDTDAVYDMMPLTSPQVVIGKYLAALAVTLVPTLIMALYPVTAGIFTPVDVLQSYASWIAFVLFEAAWLAVCVFIAASARSYVRAYVWCYSVALVWYIIGIAKVLVPLTPVASLVAFAILAAALAPVLWVLTRSVVFSIAVSLATEAVLAVVFIVSPDTLIGGFESFIEDLSIFRSFDKFVYGVFSIKGILLFVLLTVVFVFLAVRRYELRTVAKKREGIRITGFTSVMLSVCIVFAALAVNFGAAAAPDSLAVFDVTSTKKNTVSDKARSYLSGVDKDVTLYLLEPTGEVEVERYLDSVQSCNDRITLEKVYYVNTPEFYTEREIDVSTITANSIVVQCGDKWEYLAYADMFSYYLDSESLGTMDMTAEQYNYYLSMFYSSETYAEYLQAFLYDTTRKFNGDSSICTYVEYVCADVIPTPYYFTGHGTVAVTSSTTPFSMLGFATLDTLSDVPADAACILINKPTEDITPSEKDALLSYLERGGQLTVLTDSKAAEFENLMAVLAVYGMSTDGETVSVKAKSEEGEKTEKSGEELTSSFVPAMDYENDIIYYLEDTIINITVKDTNEIHRDATVKNKLIHYPLLLTPAEEGGTQTVVACAAETTDNGAHVVWFTGADSYNTITDDSYAPVVYALSWVTLEFTSEVEEMPATIYVSPIKPIETSTTMVKVIVVALPVLIMAFGAIVFYCRKKAKWALLRMKKEKD